MFSPSWYRVARLRPRLRPHARIHRHFYRGELWYVVQDPVSGRFHRFTPAAYSVVGLLDGRRTLAEVWEEVVSRLGDDAPTQEEVIRLLTQLHRADLLLSDGLVPAEEIVERQRRQRRRQRLQHFKNPLALRIPLLDPDRLLDVLAPLARPLFTLPGFLLWLAVMGWGGMTALSHWPALTENLSDRVLALENLWLLTLAFVVVKACHELGHGLAVKRWGGEVHEMGIMLLVLMPVPYVDASAASAFPEKGRRIVVGAAGMMVELLIAALALLVWLQAEPGALRALAFNVLFVSGVSTLLFNGNPLLRFDGYYILADWLEIPNLGQRANQYVGYLIQRHLFRIEKARSPVAARGEAPWLLGYAIASFIYRMVVMLAIALFVAGQYFTLGLLLALWAVFLTVLLPLGRQLLFLARSPVLQGRRGFAVAMSGVVVGVLVLLLGWVPLPYAVRAEGVLWVPERAQVQAGVDCRLERVVVESGTVVARGQVLLHCTAPELAAQAKVMAAQLAELRARYDQQRYEDRVQAQLTRQEMRHLEAAAGRLAERLAERAIRSPADGVLVFARPQDLPGRHVRQGEALGYVLETAAPPIARVVVDQDGVEVARDAQAIEIRLARRLDQVWPAYLVREVPEATDRLPGPALSLEGGGPFAAQGAGGELRTLQRLFQFELELPETTVPGVVGERVYVLFRQAPRPLAWQAYRGLRQLFLSRLGI